MISFTQALNLGINLGKKRKKTTTKCHIFNAYNKILASDIISSKNLPPFDNSAMDGYAMKLSDVGKECICDGVILAGSSVDSAFIKKGHCYKVMTGAALPKGSEVVVQIELVEIKDKNIIITKQNDFKLGQNIRFCGEEIKAGQTLLKKGKRLNSLDIGIIASLGIESIKVYKDLKISIFSSGDEVIEPGESAKEAQIYNSNAATIFTRLQSLGYKLNYGGIIKDNIKHIKSALKAHKTSDVIITSGGASVGDADLFKQVLLKKGARFLYDGISIKPGRHLCIAILKKQIIILLPGNPLASMLNLQTLIIPLLESMQGSKMPYFKGIQLKINQNVNLNENITTLLLGRIKGNSVELYKKGKIGSSSLSAMWQNEVIIVCEHIKMLPKDAVVTAILYNNAFCDTMDFINRI